MKLLVLALFFSASVGVLLPEVSGPHKIGTLSLKLVDQSREDPFAPTPQRRAVLVTLFYPTRKVAGYARANLTGPIEAAYVDAQLNISGTVETIKSRAYAGAPVQKYPLALFSHGYGSLKEFYTEIVEDLASRGYVVAAIAHPYDTQLVEYPDGTIVLGGLSDNIIKQAQQVRVQDSRFVLDALSWKNVTKQIGVKLDTDCVGMFGHSLGGSTAADVMLADGRVVAGINLDGAFVGEASYGYNYTGGYTPTKKKPDLKRPFFIMSNELHNRTSDPTLAAFWKAQSGWKRELAVKGAVHGSFGDYGTLVDLLDLRSKFPAEYLDELVGTIKGLRMNKIVTTYVGAFFDFTMKNGSEKLFNDKSVFPEVSFS